MSKVAVLFSGGHDSLLASALEINKGNEIVPIFCYNGHIEGKERIQIAIDELRNRFGKELVYDAIQLNTGFTMQSLVGSLWRIV